MKMIRHSDETIQSFREKCNIVPAFEGICMETGIISQPL